LKLQMIRIIILYLIFKMLIYQMKKNW